ncbi:MAG: PTS lactose/cellobiose transporter subunit IIA [Erysipelotrichaceae bacterium]|nr:PTS lactose/cellobiose transporter subunit IIA [Erysipelotrichaceae bacterium]
MEGLELVSFQIIAAAGSARSSYVEALQAAKQGNFEEAEALIKQGDTDFVEAHHVHAELIQKFAGGEDPGANILLIHAEDQVMSAEVLKLMALEFIDLYKRLAK